MTAYEPAEKSISYPLFVATATVDTVRALAVAVRLSNIGVEWFAFERNTLRYVVADGVPDHTGTKVLLVPAVMSASFNHHTEMVVEGLPPELISGPFVIA